MLFIVTMKWNVDKTPEVAKRAIEESTKKPPKGVKSTTYQLLGRCQALSIVEAPDEKAIAQIHTPFMDVAECDWAPAMLSDELLKILS